MASFVVDSGFGRLRLGLGLGLGLGSFIHHSKLTSVTSGTGTSTEPLRGLNSELGERSAIRGPHDAFGLNKFGGPWGGGGGFFSDLALYCIADRHHNF